MKKKTWISLALWGIFLAIGICCFCYKTEIGEIFKGESAQWLRYTNDKKITSIDLFNQETFNYLLDKQLKEDKDTLIYSPYSFGRVLTSLASLTSEEEPVLELFDKKELAKKLEDSKTEDLILLRANLKNDKNQNIPDLDYFNNSEEYLSKKVALQKKILWAIFNEKKPKEEINLGIINAIKFEGKWESENYKTKEDAFIDRKWKKTQTTFIDGYDPHKKGIDNNDHQTVRIYTKNQTSRITLIKPKIKGSKKEKEEKIREIGSQIITISKKFNTSSKEYDTVNIQFLKTKIKDSINLLELFDTLKIKKYFNLDKINLANQKIDSAQQITMLEMDEEGIKAQAYSEVNTMTFGITIEPKEILNRIGDSPYFIIIENKNADRKDDWIVSFMSYIGSPTDK